MNDFHLNYAEAVRKARRHHHYLAHTLGLPPAIPTAGLVLPDGLIGLPLVDGLVATYYVEQVIAYRCRLSSLNSEAATLDKALAGFIGLERVVRAAQAKSNIVQLPIAAE